MIRTLLVATAGLALAACASGPDYRPAAQEGAIGYSEQAVESDRFIVTYKGGIHTPREWVETYLLHRAAELTLQQGFDHFLVIDRDTDSETRLRADPLSSSRFHFGFHYTYFHPHYGWIGAYDPYWRSTRDYRQITRYQANAEIVLRNGEKPSDEPRAFDARAVMENLGPKVNGEDRP